MSNRGFDPAVCIKPLNNIKRALLLREGPFSRESMVLSLKNCGLPTNSVFWRIFKSSILQEVSKGQFMFIDTNPIFVGVLNKIKSDYNRIIQQYTKGKKSEEVRVIEPEHKVDEVQDAINLLKSKGYLVYVPC